jgi:hypothetical protein
VIRSALWRRLDTPGHDACLVTPSPRGCTIEGTAVFRHDGAPARLAYAVLFDEAWRTRTGSVTGFVGTEPVDVRIERSPSGSWSLNGLIVPGLETCGQLDLGFTPATNLAQLASLGLRIGEKADLPVAWLDVPPAPLLMLPQRYERRSETTYWYEGPSVPYAGTLELTPDDLIRKYPDLWELED